MNGPKCAVCSVAPCFYSCSCQLVLCAGCYLPHTSSPGTHNVMKYIPAPQNEGSLTCDECQNAEAESICSCVEPIRKYCLSCRLVHIGNTPYDRHFLVPIKAIAYATTKADVEELFQEMNKMTKIKQGLVANLQKIDTFKDSLQGICAVFIKEIHEFEAKTVANVDEIRTIFAAMILAICNELEEHVFDRAYKSASAAIESIKSTPEEHLSATLSVFDFHIHPQTCTHFLKSTISYEHISDLMELGAFTVTLHNRHLSRFAIPNGKQFIDTLPIETPARTGTAFAFLDLHSILGVGGVSSARVFSLHCPSKTLRNYPMMNYQRAWPGIYLQNGTLYVFGGYSAKHLTCSEKLHLDVTQWESIGFMQVPRCGFNPAKFQGMILLVGGQGARGKCEKFDIASEKFTLLSFALPKIDFSATSVEAGSEVVVLTAGKKYRIADIANIVEVEQGGVEVYSWSHLIVHTKEFVYFFTTDEGGPKALHRMTSCDTRMRSSESIFSFPICVPSVMIISSLSVKHEIDGCFP